MKHEEDRSLVRAATSVTKATLVSRILGLVRDQVVAYLFGAKWQTDAFNVAFRIPNMLRDLFAEGAFSAAFVPTFTEARIKRGETDAWLLANRVITLLVVILSIVTLLIAIFARPMVLALASGFAATPGKVELAAQMTRIMSPFLLFIAIAAVMMGVLNTHGRFFIPAVAPAAFNVACIVCAILLAPLMPRFGLEPIVSLAIGALIGAIGQFVIQVPSAARCGFRFRPMIGWSDPGVRKMVGLMIPATVGLSATQVSILVDNQFASRYGEGAITYLSLAFRVIQLPIGLFGVAIATANLAAVSRHAAAGDMDGLKNNVARAIRLAAFLTLPATAGLVALREPIIRMIYEHGKFTHSDTVRTADVLLMYTIGLFAYSLVKILVPTFYALNDTKVPVRSSMISVAIKIAVNFPLTWWLGFAGLALSTSISAVVNLGLLSFSMRRKTGGLAGRGVGDTCARICLASVGVGLAAWGAMVAGGAWLGPGRIAQSFVLAGAVAAGIAALVVTSKLLKIGELDELVARFLPRLASPRLGGGR